MERNLRRNTEKECKIKKGNERERERERGIENQEMVVYFLLMSTLSVAVSTIR